MPKNSLTTKSLVLIRQRERTVRLGPKRSARGRERKLRMKTRIVSLDPCPQRFAVEFKLGRGP
ncbi:hypothetical protein AUF62_02950 [archaeon 13_1_20CM_52_20]|nr:MAG: hypothetical protein AUF62_02950 [archaeon 13_1_20CM_52_20]